MWLNAGHGARLLALPYELVWATTWQDEANEWIGPPLHLPGLPWLDWPRGYEEDPDGIHWKTRHIVEWAAGRPFAWVDDEIVPADREWVAAHHAGPALLHWVDPRLGLRDEDFEALECRTYSTPPKPRQPFGVGKGPFLTLDERNGPNQFWE